MQLPTEDSLFLDSSAVLITVAVPILCLQVRPLLLLILIIRVLVRLRLDLIQRSSLRQRLIRFIMQLDVGETGQRKVVPITRRALCGLVGLPCTVESNEIIEKLFPLLLPCRSQYIVSLCFNFTATIQPCPLRAERAFWSEHCQVPIPAPIDLQEPLPLGRYHYIASIQRVLCHTIGSHKQSIPTPPSGLSRT